MRRYKTEHTTADELNFLKQIGSFHISGNGDLKRHIKLLNNYRNSAIERENWERVKKEVILDFVDKKIKELKNQESKV
jgi:hypothetical protein